LNEIKNSASLIGIVSVFVILLVPIPGFLIDFLLVFSMGAAVMIYLRAASIEEWDELSTFPTILLFTALFRIMLNVSTTKKILVDGDPGQVIEAAGSFVVGSSVGVGIVIFIILIVFQFIVANGASRTAEVAARFTLDSMPGKQMSIDADQQQGIITKEEAKEKRKKLDIEIDFYGSMDGAGKFIKGDVILGIVLTLINITAGLIVGMWSKGMSLQESAYRYTLLTVGDGVVNQISSLMVAIAAGIVMTRVYNGKGKDVTKSIFSELSNNPKISYISSGIFLFIGIATPLPIFPFVVIAALLAFMGIQRSKEVDTEKKDIAAKKLFEEQEKAQRETESVEVLTELEPITLEVGLALVPVVENEKNGVRLQDKITMMRKHIARELGVKIPSIHVVDNSSLVPYTKYNILIKDSIVASGELQTNSVLALKTPYTMKEIEGIPTKDPIYGEDAIWVGDKRASEAKEKGYTVLDPLNIIATHLNEMIRRNLHELIQRQEVKNLLDTLERGHKVLIEEMEKEEIGLAIIQGVVKNLLLEGVSVRDLSTIVEAIIDCKTHRKAEMHRIDDVTAIVRERLSKQICEKRKNQSDNTLYVLLLPSELESSVQTLDRHDGYYLNFDAKEEMAFVQQVYKEVQKANASDVEPVLLTNRKDLRFGLARLLHKYSLSIAVVGTNELVPGFNIKPIGTIAFEK
jgi:flagellar biosynthesis protein FlhA